MVPLSKTGVGEFGFGSNWAAVDPTQRKTVKLVNKTFKVNFLENIQSFLPGNRLRI